MLTAWLIPAAWFNARTRRIPNWLTLSPLPLALWWAWGHGALGPTLTMLSAGYLAFRFGGLLRLFGVGSSDVISGQAVAVFRKEGW